MCLYKAADTYKGIITNYKKKNKYQSLEDEFKWSNISFLDIMLVWIKKKKKKITFHCFSPDSTSLSNDLLI